MEKRRLFQMTEIEQNMLGKALALRALNRLRSSYLAAGRYSDGIDAVILKLLHSRYRRVPGCLR